MNERILALDVGDARIGVAVSDPGRTIASPVEVVRRVGWGPDTKRILELCRTYDTNLVLSGLPLNMDGSEGFQAQKVKQFCNQLAKNGLMVYYQDERLSTVTAEDALLEGNVSRAGRKKVVDKVAAAIILQQWLDAEKEKADRAKKDKANEEINNNAKESGLMADKKNDQNPMNEEEMEDVDDIVTFYDEDDQEVHFQVIAQFDYKGRQFLALTPVEMDKDGNLVEDDDADELDVLFMEISQDEKGEEIYLSVEDEKEEEELWNELNKLLEEQDDEND